MRGAHTRRSSSARTSPGDLPQEVRWPYRHLMRAGLHPGRFLGMGYDGVVFGLESGFVVKATTCYAEACFFLWLMEMGGHPGFPAPVEVLQIIGKWKGDTLYAVIREDVPDLEFPDLDYFYSHAGRLPVRGLRPYYGDGTSRADWQWSVDRALASAQPALAAPLRGLTDVLTWALEAGCAFPPIHEGNLGARGTQVVLRDLSRAYPPLPWYRKKRVLKRVATDAPGFKKSQDAV